ncbi:MAG: LysM peptidoglycan-binding domain-containing protein [Anaerolineae bacterium]
MRGTLSKIIITALLLTLWISGLSVAQAAPPEPPVGLGEEGVHVVQSGETLSAIALRYGLTVQELTRANGLTNPNFIYVGQELVIPGTDVPQPKATSEPPEEPRVHVVAAKETLSTIARLYGRTVKELVIANGLTNPNLIHVGQRLVIPPEGLEAGLLQPFDPSRLPAPFTAVELNPWPVAQGQTVIVKVLTEEEVTLSGVLDQRPLTFVGEKGLYWALVGIHAMASPGLYNLRLTAVDATGRMVSTTGAVQVVSGNFGLENISLPPERMALLDPALLQAERERLAQVFQLFSPRRLWGGLFRPPVEKPRITSPFGTRRSYNRGPASSYHEGIDYGAAEGTPVLAASDGRVALAETLTVRGKAVIIEHGLGVYSGYWHMSAIDVQVGQMVEQGDPIGKVGDTGLASGAHLHWEIRVGDMNVDPMQWTRQVMLP